MPPYLRFRRSLNAFFVTFLVTAIGTATNAQTVVEKPLDIGPEAIRRAVQQVEIERRGPVRAPFKGPMVSQVARVRVYTIDTRDRESCETFARLLTSVQRARATDDDPTQLCAGAAAGPNESPIKTVAVMDRADAVEFRRSLDANLLSTDKNLVTDTRNLALGMGAVMGLLWIMPESVTKWDKQKIRDNPGGLVGQWKDNVRQGPVVDHDNPWINYVGHPLSGAATYTMARHNGNSPLVSAGYSIAMSTFFWEYGVEAFAEVPSIQDLIITPLIGSLMGEVFIGIERHIHNNGDTVFGSRRLGKIALIVLSPADAFSRAVNSALGKTMLKNGSTDIVLRRYHNAFGQQINAVGFELKFEFHGP